MANWGRNTPWRQGHFLSAECVQAFELARDQPPGNVAVVVISHDCDLAQSPEAEPVVEVIVGRFLDGVEGNYTNNKNLRRLHSACNGGSAARFAEFEIRSRQALPKEAADGTPSLAGFAPCPLHRLNTSECNVLQLWLAARYRRSAFPDEFDRRLKDETRIADALSKAFKSSGEHVTAVFFDVDNGEEVTRNGPTEPYALRITLLYSTEKDPEAAEAAAANTAAKVEEMITTKCLITANGIASWQWIELVCVEVIADTALTYAQSLSFKKWQADHISLKSDPAQPMLQV